MAPTAAIASSRAAPDKIERQLDLARFAFHGHRRVERAEQAARVGVSEAHAVAGLEAFCRTCKRAPAIFVHPLDQIEGDFRLMLVAKAHTFERCGNDARIVENERVAGPQ